jgi:uncharacterized tellurite resistance protein B-like protein
MTAEDYVVAVFGTTSSGKSTFLNGLIGEHVLPVDAGEVSAGIVRMYGHAHPCALTIHDGGEAAPWNETRLEGISSKVVLGRLNGLLSLYQYMRLRQPDLPTPKVEVGVLMDHARRILAWPVDVPLTVLDLPGLRTSADDILDKSLELVGASAAHVLPVCIVDVTRLHDHETLRAALLTASRFSTPLNPPILLLNKVDRLNFVDDRAMRYLEDAVSISRGVGFELSVDNICPTNAMLFASASFLLGAVKGFIYEQKVYEPALIKYFSQTVQFAEGMIQKIIHVKNQQLFNQSYSFDLDDLSDVLSEQAKSIRRQKISIDLDLCVTLAHQALELSGVNLLSQKASLWLARSRSSSLDSVARKGRDKEKYDAVRSALLMLILADSVIVENELNAASSSLCEYAERFLYDGFLIENVSGLIAADSVLNQLDLSLFFNALSGGILSRPELVWLVNVLQSLAFADGELDPAEASLIQIVQEQLKLSN